MLRCLSNYYYYHMHLIVLHKSSEKKNKSWKRTQSHDQFVNVSSKMFLHRNLNHSYISAERAASGRPFYTVNHKKRDILFLTITLASLDRFL